MDAAHARLGPSSAHRWLRCPASIPLSETVAQRPAGSAAKAGTLMHGVFERRLLGLHDFTRNELESLRECEVAEPRARLIVEQAVVAAQSVMAQYQLKEFLTETRVNTGALMGRSDFWGTADLIAADAQSKTVLVGDLKTGRGRVDVEYNDQLLAYAVGALELIDFIPQRVVLAIFQPPVLACKAAVWETTPGILDSFAAFASAQAALTDDPSASPSPSQAACQWCPARSVCPAHACP